MTTRKLTYTILKLNKHMRFISNDLMFEEPANNKTVAEIFKDIACNVCAAPSSGLHFGAITCEGCKVKTTEI
jgi:hypothetical protein